MFRFLVMRDEEWLATFFHKVWDSKFPDVKKKNNVVVRWKGKWKNKFGHIRRLKNKDTEIAINSLFTDEKVPEWVIELTLAHELIHYMHGFHSPYPKLFKHPHKGGIVNKELKLRGYSGELKKERIWFKEFWSKELTHKAGRIKVRHVRNSLGLF